MAFLPATAGEAARANPDGLDAIIVSGDAYVDHSSFGAAIIGRTLEAAGFSVGILARPDPDDPEAFRLLGRPRLAFLVTSGVVDSMVSSYTANKKIRSEDDYAPGGDRSICLRADGSLGLGLLGRPNARPDRAVIAYAGMCRQAYKGVPVILGGLEASLRRLSHYDYWSDQVRRSILLDSKADLLIYGMGEAQIVEALGRLRRAGAEGSNLNPALTLSGIRGTVWAGNSKTSISSLSDALHLPSFESAQKPDVESKKAFAASFATQYRNTDPYTARRLIEACGDRIVVQEPPAFPPSREELDRIYALPFERKAHPMYEPFGGVPALAEVKFSLLSSRGCFGACSFCAITFHQGRNIVSRSPEAIIEEARILTGLPGFKGYIHDVGGPTANFRVPACEKMAAKGACTDRRCLAPEPCSRLAPDHREFVNLLRKLRSLPGMKKVFIRSGVRFDYAMLDKDETFLRELVRHHISGQLKVAPEHASNAVLDLMGKPPHEVYDAFTARYRALAAEEGLPQYLVPYFISGHPGAGLTEAIELAEYIRDTGFVPDQAQDFYPTPGTRSTAMWYCEFDPISGKTVHVAKSARERAMQRALLQFNKPENAALAREALMLAGRGDLIGRGPHCLVPPEAKGSRHAAPRPGAKSGPR